MVNSKRRELPAAQDRRETKRLAKSAVAVAEAPSLFSKVAPALADTSPAPSSDSRGSDNSANSVGDGIEDAVDFAIASMSTAAERRARALHALRDDMDLPCGCGIRERRGSLLLHGASACLDGM
eukprot:jgi/Tetstr1/466520/TSEL_011027.t1